MLVGWNQFGEKCSAVVRSCRRWWMSLAAPGPARRRPAGADQRPPVVKWRLRAPMGAYGRQLPVIRPQRGDGRPANDGGNDLPVTASTLNVRVVPGAEGSSCDVSGRW